MTTSCGEEINTTFKTTVICKRDVKKNVLSSVAFEQMYQQKITMRRRDSKEISVLQRRWIGYRVSASDEYKSPSVFVKYDETVYPINRSSMHKEAPKCITSSSEHSSREPERKWYSRWIMLLVCFLLSVIVISGYLLLQKTCIEAFNTQKFRDILNENVFGQDEIKDQLIRTIENMNFSVASDLKFLVFSGRSGVGKTYVASLIAQSFPWPENVQSLMASVHSELSAGKIHKHLSSCGYNLVIIDDLKEGDVEIIWELKRRYELMNRQLLKVIFIFIFSSQQNFTINDTGNSYGTQVEGNSRTFDQSVIHYQFKQLEDGDILKFIKKSLYKKGITEPQIINDFFNRFKSPYFLEGGCKRISSKLALFLEMYEQKKLRVNF